MGQCAKIRWEPKLLVSIFISILIGFMSFVSFVIGIIRKGPSRMLRVTPRNVRPQILSDSTYGTHGFARLRSTRLKLHYVANGPTDKPLLLFVHGFPEFWYSWRHQLKEFSKDYRAVAFDMRGYGDSDKPSGICEYTLDKLVEDINQLLAELGYKKCVLVGHDWGGAVAWSFASVHPDKVEKLIVGNCPHPKAFEKHITSSFSQLKKSWYMFFFQIPVLPLLFLRSDDLDFLKVAFCGRKMGAKQGAFTSEDIEAFKYTFANYDDLCGPVNFYRSANRYVSPRVDEAVLRKITMPTLMIWGTKDGALEASMAELSGRYVEQYQLRYIEGASHWVQQDEPEQFNSLMRQFLNNKL